MDGEKSVLHKGRESANEMAHSPPAIARYPDVMDIGQMCEALGVSTKTGYKLLKDGKIEYLKIGRAYRIPKAHILRYLKITCSTFAE